MFETKRILVIGDVMLDVYFAGEVNRISPEAPVPVFKKKDERCVLGGAGNVAANLVAANQKTSVIAMVGNDSDGDKIRGLFSDINLDSSMLNYWNRPTITKTRFLAENNQQVLRLDIEEASNISEIEVSYILDEFENVIEEFDVVLLSDYMKGLLTLELTQGIITISKLHKKKVLVDVKDPDYVKYRGAWLLKPNIKELNSLTHMPVSTDEEVVAAAKYLLSETECDYVLITCGAKGMVLVDNNTVFRLDTVSKSVYDVTGAGDTTIAYLTAAIANEIEIKEAMKIANYAAGIQVSKVGTSAVFLHEVEKAMSFSDNLNRNKVFRINERRELFDLINFWRNNRESIVTTNGCFDIIHRGHITLLEKAKSYADHLIVLINTDASVKRLKGASRPINSEEDRAMVIAALDCVDAVVLFDPFIDNCEISESELEGMSEELRKIARESPMGILKMISPDVHAKGGDYTIDQVPEAIFAKEYKTVSFVDGYSTSRIIESHK